MKYVDMYSIGIYTCLYGIYSILDLYLTMMLYTY